MLVLAKIYGTYVGVLSIQSSDELSKIEDVRGFEPNAFLQLVTDTTESGFFQYLTSGPTSSSGRYLVRECLG